MPTQQQNPRIIGFPPVFINLIIFVFRPIAAIARTIKNLLNSLTGLKIAISAPAETAIVVITDARIKYRINIGKIDFNLILFPFACVDSFRVRINAKMSVIGIMARVRVNFTVTAVSKVAEPRFHILSQVEAAAVTDEVSFTAVPENIPKAVPVSWENPRKEPSVGNIKAARTLKKKITEIACATSSSSASITGAVAATAEPPQIEEPTPTNVDILLGICIMRCSIYAITNDIVIVLIIIGSDCFPVSRITIRFIPNPKRMTAHCNTFLDANLIPFSKEVLSFIKSVIIMPAIMAITAPPIIGNAFPANHDGIAIHRHNNRPL